jgi:NTE family protein
MTRRNFVFRPLLITAILLLSTFSVLADSSNSDSSRPKIGLALAGGSALGFSHVGVLLWMDEHHIPIDYIAGTSMGGLIGGGYATGMSPKELENLLTGIDWSAMLSSQPPYDTLTFRRREDLREYPNAISFGVKNGGIALPGGLNPAHPIGLLLSRICLPYPSLVSFDQLPTPFRCVAVDMEKGEPVEFSNGSLETALRATMAIPGYFTPVTRDGRVLADGGFLDNLPTSSLKEMKADVIIAVDLSPQLASRSELKSFASMLAQSSDITILENERRSLKLADIVISPDLSSLNSIDFFKVQEFIKRGYNAAEKQKTVLLKYSLNDHDWNEYLAQRAQKRHASEIVPQFIDVTGVSNTESEIIKKHLRDFYGRPLDRAKLEKRLTELTGDGKYASINYQRAVKNNQEGLLIGVEPKSYGPPFMNFNIKVDGANSDHILTTFESRMTMMEPSGDETRYDFKLGSETAASAEFYHPIPGSRFFIAPKIEAKKTDQNLYAGTNQLSLATQTSNSAAIDLGYNPSVKSQIRFGASAAHFDESIQSDLVAPNRLDGSLTKSYLNVEYDGLENGLSSMRGHRQRITVTRYINAPDADQSFTTLEGSTAHLLALSKSTSILALASGGYAFHSQLPIPQKFMLGGPFSLSAYGPNEFEGNAYYAGALGLIYRVVDIPPPLNSQLKAGVMYEQGAVSDNDTPTINRRDIALYALVVNPLFPVLVGYGFGENGEHNIFFRVGSVF